MNEEPEKSRSLEITVGIIILIGLIVSMAAFIDAKIRNSHREEAFGNARALSSALFEFDDNFGCYPNDETSTEVTEKYPSHGYDLSGKSSNAAFRQLMAAGIILSEEMFYAKIDGSIRPDGTIIPGEALKKGEVGLSYIAGLSTKNDPATPLIVTPLIPGTRMFDPKPFKGKAVILHIDNSVFTYDIAKDGHVYDKKGIDILSSKHPVWKGKVPDIRYPE